MLRPVPGQGQASTVNKQPSAVFHSQPAFRNHAQMKTPDRLARGSKSYCNSGGRYASLRSSHGHKIPFFGELGRNAFAPKERPVGARCSIFAIVPESDESCNMLKPPLHHLIAVERPTAGCDRQFNRESLLTRVALRIGWLHRSNCSARSEGPQ